MKLAGLARMAALATVPLTFALDGRSQAPSRSPKQQLSSSLRLYVFDCGILHIADPLTAHLRVDYIAASMKNGSAWVEYYWCKPAENTPVRKQAYVRRVQSGQDTYVVGSGVYME
jgi:hypothetical protein